MYIQRSIEKIVREAASSFPALIVTGPRQSGKTTLLKHLFAGSHRYITLDDPALRLMASEDPALLFQNFPPPLIIDEVQYAPGIFSTIKLHIDATREKVGQFILTGSQGFPLMSGVSESLAGRMAVFTLLGLSWREVLKDGEEPGLSTIRKGVLRGGFPEVVTKEKMNLQLWFSGYLQTYLERDVRQLRQVGDLMDFQRFLQLLATMNGQLMNLSSFARDLGVSVNTVKAWVSVLDASGQVFLLNPYFVNRGKRLIQSSRIYFLDSGLWCHLAGVTTSEQAFQGPGSGQLLETMVLGELVRSYYNRGMVPRIYFWRTSNGEEVDFIIEEKGRLIPLEVKLAGHVTAHMVKNLIAFSTLFEDRVEEGMVITLSGKRLKIHERVTAIPFADFVREPFLE